MLAPQGTIPLGGGLACDPQRGRQLLQRPARVLPYRPDEPPCLRREGGGTRREPTPRDSLELLDPPQAPDEPLAARLRRWEVGDSDKEGAPPEVELRGEDPIDGLELVQELDPRSTVRNVDAVDREPHAQEGRVRQDLHRSEEAAFLHRSEPPPHGHLRDTELFGDLADRRVGEHPPQWVVRLAIQLSVNLPVESHGRARELPREPDPAH